jgi:3-carboxy-cis,cis-muconate cycloisomerase
VGTLTALGDRGIQVMEHLAAELDLAVPVATWHTVRDRPAQLACGLGMALGTMGKIAQDVVLLAQNEIGELREAADETRGGSSAMPQKRNPVSAIAVLSCATRGPGLVATVLASMVQEHERAAGRWQAEWETLAELLHLAARAAAATRELLEGLEIDGRRMRANLLPVSMSEAVVAALSRSLDGQQARQIVQDAARAAAGRPGSFREVLLETPEVAQTLGEAGLDRALEPERWLGSTQELIDRALAAHRRPLGW